MIRERLGGGGVELVGGMVSGPTNLEMHSFCVEEEESKIL